MLILIAVVVGIATLIIFHEWGHFFTAKVLGLKVDEFGVGFPPRLLSWKRGETRYSLNWLPLGGFVKIAGEGENEETLQGLPPEEKARLFVFQAAWKKLVVVTAGVFMNLLLGWLILFLIFLVGTPRGIVINEVKPGSPAERAGLKPNEMIIGYRHTLTDATDQSEPLTLPPGSFSTFIQKQQGKTIELLVKNATGEKTVPVTLPSDSAGGRAVLGIYFSEVGVARHELPAALRASFDYTVAILRLTYQSLFGLFRDIFVEAKVSEGVVGPVGIFSFAYETGRLNLIYLFHLLSIISLNLAVLNLIPFPALDGGHVLMILVEKVKGSPLRHRTKNILNTLGISLLMLLVLLLTVRDIQSLGL